MIVRAPARFDQNFAERATRVAGLASIRSLPLKVCGIEIPMMTSKQIAIAARLYATKQVESNLLPEADDKPEYELLFDSYAQPAGDAIRNSITAARQLLFRIGAIFVDVELGRRTDSNSASLVGQMLDSSNPGRPPAGVVVALVDGGRRIAASTTNDCGEFRFEFAPRENLRLSVRLDHRKPVYLPLVDPPGAPWRRSEDPVTRAVAM